MGFQGIFLLFTSFNLSKMLIFSFSTTTAITKPCTTSLPNWKKSSGEHSSLKVSHSQTKDHQPQHHLTFTQVNELLSILGASGVLATSLALNKCTASNRASAPFACRPHLTNAYLPALSTPQLQIQSLPIHLDSLLFRSLLFLSHVKSVSEMPALRRTKTLL